MIMLISFVPLITGLPADSQQASFVWSKPETATLFAPGIFAPAGQVEKYLPYVFDKKAKTWIPSAHGNKIINGDFCYSCSFAEIWPAKSLLPLQENFLRRIAGSLIDTIIKYRDRQFAAELQRELRAQKQYTISLSQLNFGQEPDVEILSGTYDDLVADPEMPENVVLYGFSRGAATTFNFMATRYEQKSVKRVKAIILEACYDSLISVLPFGVPTLLEYFLPTYHCHGLEPARRAVFDQFVTICKHYQIPVLFITSKADKIVPYRIVIQLYDRVKKAGVDAHLLVLSKASHAGYLFDNKKDRARFHHAVHTFYGDCGLSYISAFVEENS
jgi:dienelactone hydrolase